MGSSEGKVTVKVPSSIANLGPGFDVFALALKAPYDVLTLELTNESGVHIHVKGYGSESIPLTVEGNTAGRVSQVFLDRFGIDKGIKLTIQKGIRPGFGLGSSGADAAATAFALNKVLGLKLTRNELVGLAAQGELASSNSVHADNVSASLLGGFTIVRSYDPLDVLSFQPPRNLGICITIPNIEPQPKKTAVARAILPEKVSLTQLTHNVGNASSLVYGMITKDIKIVGNAMDDKVVEPVRSMSIPGYKQVKEGAFKQGALGVAICGAGPSIAAFYDSNQVRPGPILESMAHGFKIAGINSYKLITDPGEGAKIVNE